MGWGDLGEGVAGQGLICGFGTTGMGTDCDGVWVSANTTDAGGLIYNRKNLYRRNDCLHVDIWSFTDNHACWHVLG